MMKELTMRLMHDRASSKSSVPVPRADWFKTLDIRLDPHLLVPSNIQPTKKLREQFIRLNATIPELDLSNFFRNTVCSSFNTHRITERSPPLISLIVNTIKLVDNLIPDLVLVPTSEKSSPSPFRCLAVGELKTGTKLFTDDNKGQVLEYATRLMNLDPSRVSIVCFLINVKNIQFFEINRKNGYEVGERERERERERGESRLEKEVTHKNSLLFFLCSFPILKVTLWTLFPRVMQCYLLSHNKDLSPVSLLV
jgi:hypothetical protein